MAFAASIIYQDRKFEIMKTFDINEPANQNNPFRIPEGYFVQFSERMMSRISKIHSTAITSRPREMRIVRWIPMLGAACVAALAVIFATTVSTSGIRGESVSAAETSQSAYANEDLVYDYIMWANVGNYINGDTEYE